MIHIRYCKRCKAAFDNGDYEICSECRDENKKEFQKEVEDYGR